MDEKSLFQNDKNEHPFHFSRRIDKILGFGSSKIELKLLQKYRAYYKPEDKTNKKKHYVGTQAWIGLHPQALQTPYCDIYDALKLIGDSHISRIIDIGAGYGRVGHVMKSIFPSAHFLGYEIVKQRQREANRVFELNNLTNCHIELRNVLEDDFVLPKAQVYFMYDFSEMDDLCQILDQLSQRISHENFFLITKGDRLDFLLSKKYKEFWKGNGYLKKGDLKIYSSCT